MVISVSPCYVSKNCKLAILWLRCSHCVQPQLSFSALNTPRAGLFNLFIWLVEPC
jgi:hypothetical protein